jgi:hypothetical protein
MLSRLLLRWQQPVILIVPLPPDTGDHVSWMKLSGFVGQQLFLEFVNFVVETLGGISSEESQGF